MEATTRIVEIFLGCVMLAAALAKIHRRAHLARNIERVLESTARFGRVAAGMVVLAEAVFGVMLLLGVTTRATTLGLIVLLAVFTWALIRLNRGAPTDGCMCFGELDIVAGTPRLQYLRNACLLVLAFWILMRPAPTETAVYNPLLVTLTALVCFIAGVLFYAILAVIEKRTLRSRRVPTHVSPFQSASDELPSMNIGTR